MSRCNSISVTAAICLSFLLTCLQAQEKEPESNHSFADRPDWLEGDGAAMRIRVTGAVLDENESPATEFEFSVRMETEFGVQTLDAEVSGNHFSFGVPVGKSQWFRVEVKATSHDKQQTAARSIDNFDLREAAIKGVELAMERTERTVMVTVGEGANSVPNAIVTASLMGGEEVSSHADDNGVATLQLMNRDRIHQLTARTDDFRVGGYAFHRDPPRDPAGSTFTVEIERCRAQRIRMVNVKDGTVIPGLDFSFTVGTGPPNYQFTGKTPDSVLSTDANGEAIYRWFPDWKTHGAYATIANPAWVRDGDSEMEAGVLVVRLRASKASERKRVTGRIRSTIGSAAGYLVCLSSFQGEEKNRSDFLYAFSNSNGEFQADCLPGATYCIFVNDARYVSEIVDLIPWQPESGEVRKPELTVTEGQPIEVIATSGPAKRPLAHQSIQLQTPHDFSWQEGGEEKFGSGARRWFVTTNKYGRTYTYALPGQQIEGFIDTPEWRAEESVVVNADAITRLKFHQQVAAARKVSGRLILAEGLAGDLKDAVIQIGSVDGETKERQTVQANADGTFEFQSKSVQVGIFARTKDATAAVVVVLNRLDEPVELKLNPTGEFHGQLLQIDDQPLPKHGVRAVLMITGEKGFSSPFSTTFEAATFETKTDEKGNYTLSGLPYDATYRVKADSVDASMKETTVTRFELRPLEKLSREVTRLAPPAIEN